MFILNKLMFQKKPFDLKHLHDSEKLVLFLTTNLFMFSRSTPSACVLTAAPYVLKMAPYTSLLRQSSRCDAASPDISYVSQVQGSDVKRPPSLAHHLGRWIIPFGMIQLPGWPRDAYFAS